MKKNVKKKWQKPKIEMVKIREQVIFGSCCKGAEMGCSPVGGIILNRPAS